jgi:hypothetical protein
MGNTHQRESEVFKVVSPPMDSRQKAMAMHDNIKASKSGHRKKRHAIDLILDFLLGVTLIFALAATIYLTCLVFQK